MPDSLSEQEQEQLKKKAIKFALKLPAGHISSRTPLQMAVTHVLKDKKPEQFKQSELDLNNLSPFTLFNTLNSINKDWINWLPETLWQEFKCDKVTQNKIRAIQTLVTTPDVQFDAHGFFCVVKAFNNEEPDWSILEPIPCHEIVYAWKNINLINKLELWPEVEAFIKACMREEGIIWLPWLDLEELNGVEFPLKNLKVVWDKLKDTEVQINTEDPLHVQVARLQDINSYLKSMP